MCFEDSQKAMRLCNAITAKSTYPPQRTMVRIGESFGRFPSETKWYAAFRN